MLTSPRPTSAGNAKSKAPVVGAASQQGLHKGGRGQAPAPLQRATNSYQGSLRPPKPQRQGNSWPMHQTEGRTAPRTYPDPHSRTSSRAPRSNAPPATFKGRGMVPRDGPYPTPKAAFGAPPRYQDERMGGASRQNAGGDGWRVVERRSGPGGQQGWNGSPAYGNQGSLREPQDVRIKDAIRARQDRQAEQAPPPPQGRQRGENRTRPQGHFQESYFQGRRYPTHSQDAPTPRAAGPAASNGPRTAASNASRTTVPSQAANNGGCSGIDGPTEPPAFLLAGDAEARRNARIPDLTSWADFVDFVEENPDVDTTYDHMWDVLQVASAKAWAERGLLQKWVAKGAVLRPQYAAMLA